MPIPSTIACVRSGDEFGSSEKSSSPSIIFVKKSSPTARTSGSANGSLIRPWGSLVAIARPAATSVAVAPTLEARSQLSSSLRVISALFQRRGDVAHVPEYSHRLVFRESESIALVQLRGRVGGHLPAVAGEVVDHDAALALIEQIGRVEVETGALPSLADAPHAFLGEGVRVRDVLGGELASRRAERGDVVEQPVLGLRRQVGQ